MYIAPAILRLKPEPDASQQQVIAHMEVPMLVIAGPGSGKTGSIQLRAVNLLLTGRTNPNELVICTFGRDAARQLQRRFTSSAMACGVPGDFSQVNITTIHSLCHQPLKPHAALVGLWPGYRVLDDKEQRLLLQEQPDAVFGPDWDSLSRRGRNGGVQTVDEAGRYFDRICEDLSLTPRTWPSRNGPSSPLWAAVASATGASCYSVMPSTSPTFKYGPTG